MSIYNTDKFFSKGFSNSQFTSKDDVRAFQNWVSQHKGDSNNKNIHNNAFDGIYGKYTNSLYSKYGDEYNAWKQQKQDLQNQISQYSSEASKPVVTTEQIKTQYGVDDLNGYRVIDFNDLYNGKRSGLLNRRHLRTQIAGSPDKWAMYDYNQNKLVALDANNIDQYLTKKFAKSQSRLYQSDNSNDNIKTAIINGLNTNKTPVTLRDFIFNTPTNRTYNINLRDQAQKKLDQLNETPYGTSINDKDRINYNNSYRVSSNRFPNNTITNVQDNTVNSVDIPKSELAKLEENNTTVNPYTTRDLRYNGYSWL